MESTNTKYELHGLLKAQLVTSTYAWIQEKLEKIIATTSTKELYLTYSLIASKIKKDKNLDFRSIGDDTLRNYLKLQNADIVQISRLYLLCGVLENDGAYFGPKVANLIQVADTGELETFLKFLILLPQAENFKQVAVEALRTNIATVFDAISANNPYPAKYFDDRQWNQMYLKAAFMQQDLSLILEIDNRANADLARIISDYAHERWAASREVDPLFWRPVGGFLKDGLFRDMERLLQSDNSAENRAGALCCFQSDAPEASALLEKHPDFREAVADGKITWSDLKGD